MSSYAAQDVQDSIFTQILSAIHNGDAYQLEQLSQKLGDYSNKIHLYSNLMRKQFKSIMNNQHLNDEIGTYCANLFQHGFYYSSHLIYCLASHDQYVDGFTWGFLRHFIHNQWCHASDGSNRVLQPNERDIELLKRVIMGIGQSQVEKVAENIHHIIHHMTKDQFYQVLHQLKHLVGFSLRNSKDDLLIEMAIRQDDGLIEVIVNDILHGNHGHGTPEFTIPGTEEMDNVEVGFSFLLHVIPQALRKLHLHYEQFLAQGNHQKANEVLEVAHKIIHFALQVCAFSDDMEHGYLSDLWDDLETIHSWDSIVGPIHHKIQELQHERHNSTPVNGFYDEHNHTGIEYLSFTEDLDSDDEDQNRIHGYHSIMEY